MALVEPNPVRKRSTGSSKLIESYCNGCGQFIAASPLKKVLHLMEQMHRCGVHLHTPIAGPPANRKRTLR